VVTTVILRRERRPVLGVVARAALALFTSVLVTSLDLSVAEEGTEVATHRRDTLVGLLNDLQSELEAMRQLKRRGRLLRNFEQPTIMNDTGAQPVLHETVGKQPFLVYGWRWSLVYGYL
jgi:hypothetical protein